MIRVKEAILVEGRYDKIKLASLVDGVILEAGGFSLFRDREKLAYLKRLAKERGLILLTDSDGAGFVIRGKLASHIPPEHLKHAYIPDVYGKERRKAKPSKEGKLGVEGMDLATLRAALERAGATILEGEAAPSPAKQGEPVTKSDLFQLGLYGKERRKAKPSKEGKLGVEGMDLATLRAALERAGATILEGGSAPGPASQGEPVTKSDLFQLGLSGKADSAQRRKELQRALGLPERLSANGLVQAINALYSREEFLRLAGEHTTKGDG